MILLSADSPLGLQTLISSSKGGGNGSGNVATRTIAASRSAVRSLAANGREADGGGRDDGKEEGGGGCWVSYGWRRLPRRLPPAIQSPRRPLVRERTADGRLVISREEAARRVGARKVVEDRRLVLELVDDDRDGGGAAPPPRRRRRWSHPLVGQEVRPSASAAGDGEESASARGTTTSPPVAAGPVPVPVPPVPAEACFEVAIREASLRETRMSLLRMVH